MRGAVAVAAGPAAGVAAALVTAVWVTTVLAASVRLAAAWIAVTRVTVAWVAAGLVPVALMAAPRIRAGRVAPAGLADVLRVGRPGRPGPLAGVGGPGVAPVAVPPSRVVCLAPAAVVLAVRRGAHHLGHRGRVIVGGTGGRGGVRRGVAVRAGFAGGVTILGRVLLVA